LIAWRPRQCQAPRPGLVLWDGRPVGFPISDGWAQFARAYNPSSSRRDIRLFSQLPALVIDWSGWALRSIGPVERPYSQCGLRTGIESLFLDEALYLRLNGAERMETSQVRAGGRMYLCLRANQRETESDDGYWGNWERHCRHRCGKIYSSKRSLPSFSNPHVDSRIL
jgi:hypothetical protein